MRRLKFQIGYTRVKNKAGKRKDGRNESLPKRVGECVDCGCGGGSPHVFMDWLYIGEFAGTYYGRTLE